MPKPAIALTLKLGAWTAWRRCLQLSVALGLATLLFYRLAGKRARARTAGNGRA